MNQKLTSMVAKGDLRPQFDGKDARLCKRFGIGRSFKYLIKRCTEFEPEERPSMDEVASLLLTMSRDHLQRKTSPKKTEKMRSHLPSISLNKRMQEQTQQQGDQAEKEGAKSVSTDTKISDYGGPWPQESIVATSMSTFISRIEDPTIQANVLELSSKVGELLGSEAVDSMVGAYTPPTLLRFLNFHDGDVEDAISQIIVSFNARNEHEMPTKRKRIVCENLSYDTVPRALEWRQYQQYHPWLYDRGNNTVIRYVLLQMIDELCSGLPRSLDAPTELLQFIDPSPFSRYFDFGNSTNFDGFQKAFSISDFLNSYIYTRELNILVCF